MGTIAYLDCFSGISGDMTLGALIDLGVPEAHIREQLAHLPVEGYSITVSSQRRASIKGTRVEVQVDQGRQTHRTYAGIRAMLDEAPMPEEALRCAQEIFRRLAQAEGHLHGTPMDQVHFHELGAVDSIVDIVGTAIGLAYLHIDRTYVSDVPLGTGFVRCEHGVLPVPAPATLEILRGMRTRPSTIEADRILPGRRRTSVGPGNKDQSRWIWGGRTRAASSESSQDCPG
jgi:uncharacterized protein (TIGR00299 family) protein